MEYICRASRRLKNGRRIFAKNYGKRAFSFWVDTTKKQNPPRIEEDDATEVLEKTI